MSEYTRVSFRIPDRYSDILNIVIANNGVVEGAGFAPSDYDELFAIRVDDVVEAKFVSPDRANAENLIAQLVEAFDEHGVPHAIATSAKPEGIMSRSGKPVAGTVYVNPVGYVEAQDKRELPGIFNSQDTLTVMLRKSGLTSRGISLVLSAPVANGYAAAPGM